MNNNHSGSYFSLSESNVVIDRCYFFDDVPAQDGVKIKNSAAKEINIIIPVRTLHQCLRPPKIRKKIVETEIFVHEQDPILLFFLTNAICYLNHSSL